MNPVPAFAAPLTRDGLRVHGPDAEKWLQGQLSQDLSRMGVGTSTWSFLLQPQGKVDAWLRITRTATDEFLLDVDAGHGEAVRARLERFKLRTKAEIDPIELAGHAVRGDAGHPPVGGDVLRLPVVGPGVEGYDLLGAGAEVPDGADVADEAALERYRIAHGVPALGRELTEDTIPAEAGQWVIDESVSFTKGCFTGQELVARIDSRGGNVPRRLWVIATDGPVATGDVVSLDGKEVGALTSVASNGNGSVALGLLKRVVEQGASVSVDGAAGTVLAPPADFAAQ